MKTRAPLLSIQYFEPTLFQPFLSFPVKLATDKTSSDQVSDIEAKKNAFQVTGHLLQLFQP